jgi:transcriptional regulator with XRE-family HTH domain
MTAEIRTWGPRLGPRPRAQDVDRHIGARLRQRRVMNGFTQQQMADLIGVTYQQAHKYESGMNRIAAGRLYQGDFAAAFPVSPDARDADSTGHTSSSCNRGPFWSRLRDVSQTRIRRSAAARQAAGAGW